MQAVFGALTIILLFGMVLSRVVLMKRQGLQAMQFGKIDKTDFLIPPVALVYFYSIFAHALGLPLISTQTFFQSELIAWLGVIFCLIGLLLLLWSLLSFGRGFRVGIDTERPGQLVTSGIFAYSRNPIYVAFALVLFGQFLIFPNWILLAYLFAAIWLFHRQVLREEDYLKTNYGEEYTTYCNQVRRYI
jgi:protein-S-isoprenylcysteine O-methyltransferase Ste14